MEMTRNTLLLINANLPENTIEAEFYNLLGNRAITTIDVEEYIAIRYNRRRNFLHSLKNWYEVIEEDGIPRRSMLAALRPFLIDVIVGDVDAVPRVVDVAPPKATHFPATEPCHRTEEDGGLDSWIGLLHLDDGCDLRRLLKLQAPVASLLLFLQVFKGSVGRSPRSTACRTATRMA